MSEEERLNRDFQITSNEQVATDLGSIVKSEILFEDELRTVYSTSDLTEIGFQKLLQGIEEAEGWINSPLLRTKKKPAKIIDDFCTKYIAALRANKFVKPHVRESVLFPLAEQKALSILFNEAKVKE